MPAALLTEARERSGRALASGGGNAALRAVALNWSGYFAGLQDDLTAASWLAGEALRIFDKLGIA